MKKLTKLLALLAVLAMIAAACGDDDETTDAGESTSASESESASASDSASASEMAEEDEDHDHDHEEGEDHDHEHEDGESHDDDEMADDEMADETGAPQRIVSLSPSSTEMLFAMGAGDRVVGVDRFSTYPAETADVEAPDLDGFTVNIEAVAALEPDIIFMSSDAETAEAFEALGITTIQNGAAANFDEVYAQIEQTGAAVGNVGEAAELVLQMQTDIETLVADLPDVSGQTYYHELTNEYYSATSATFIGEVYGLFGLVNIADQVDEGLYPLLTEEYILDSDPNFVFLADTLCCGQTAETVAERPGWETLQAVTNGQVVELNDDIVSRWGPRIVDFIEVIATAVESSMVDA